MLIDQQHRVFVTAFPTVLCVVAMLFFPQISTAEEHGVVDRLTYNLFGAPGLIDMPTAQSAEDAELAATVGYFGGNTRTTATFQITPRLMGSFRYSRIEDWFVATGDETFDRSFDLRYRLADETRYRPAIAIGLQDFIGTGIYSGEYIVGTKNFGPDIGVTAGIGWGRFGSFNSFANPLRFLSDDVEDRPAESAGTGGQIENSKWFRGDAALFGGLSWHATDRLTLKAEYSSDDYVAETIAGRDQFERSSPLNYGLSYDVANNAQLQAFYLYGSEIGAALTFTVNPRKPVANGGTGQRPTPVRQRAPGTRTELGWTNQPDAPQILQDSVQRLLLAEGMVLEAIQIEPQSTTVLIRNETYLSGAEALGRTARILTQIMPGTIETFTIVPVVGGVRASAVTFKRTDIERLEFEPDNAWKSYARAELDNATTSAVDLVYADDLYPRFLWRLGPYISTSYFDPNNPILFEVGAELSASYDIAPGLTLEGALRKRVAGNRDEDPRESNSVIQRVRTDGPRYVAEGDPALAKLTLAYQTNFGTDLYGRMTAGYLERMYGGLSTEVLWKPPESRLGVGVELNYARQRDFDQQFGFQDYDVITGHVSGYYDFGKTWHGQLDVGRYLAGDYGATISLDREFDNGWRIGGYATFTDVSFEDFGEGSFDKGIRVSVPLSHFVGTPSRQVYRATLQPLLRDGGARLNVSGRLYETVRNYHDADLRGSWGRFWR